MNSSLSFSCDKKSEFINVLIDVFHKHNPKINEEDFQTRMHNLHYSLPSEFHDEETCIMVYKY